MNIEKTYNTWKNMNSLKYDRIHRLDQVWQSSLVKYAKSLFPRRKILDAYKASEIIGKEKTQELFQVYADKADIIMKKYDNFKDHLAQILKEFSKDYEIPFENSLYKIKSENGGSYHTQGFGANKYAKSALEEDKMLLELNGFITEIREDSRTEPDRWGVSYVSYELWANITPMNFDMLKMKGKFISVLNWAVLCWRKNTNPKVYFPFLSDKDYETSLRLSRDPSYQITSENCDKEIYE